MNDIEKLPYKNTRLEDMDGEVWIDAFGFDGIYEVSNFGRVRSVNRLINSPQGERLLRGRVLKQAKTKHIGESENVSLYVRLANGDGTYSNRSVGGLILNSFSKPDKFNITTHHINGISIDNRLANLTFVSNSNKKSIEFELNLREKCRTRFSKIAKDRMQKGLTLSIEELRNMRTGGKRKTYEKRNKKPITVFLAKKGLIRSFTSFKNASEQLNIKEYTLRNAFLKPEKYQYIQVKLGTLSMEEFNPKKKRNQIIINGMTVKEYSTKSGIPESTIFYKIRNNKKI